jgi:hypothetical protein
MTRNRADPTIGGPASAVSIGGLTPVTTSGPVLLQEGQPRFDGIPSNMSVNNRTPFSPRTLDSLRDVLARVVRRHAAQSDTVKRGSSPTIISAAFTSSVASCPCVTTTTS